MCVHEGERARETLPVLPYSKGLVMVPCRCNARGFTDPVGPLQGPDMRLPKIGTLRRGEASARPLRCVDKESLLSLELVLEVFSPSYDGGDMHSWSTVSGLSTH